MIIRNICTPTQRATGATEATEASEAIASRPFSTAEHVGEGKPLNTARHVEKS
jgi:hypothetical protein